MSEVEYPSELSQTRSVVVADSPFLFCSHITCLATVGYAILRSSSTNSTLKLTLAFNALKTSKIVSIVTFLHFSQSLIKEFYCLIINHIKQISDFELSDPSVLLR